LKSLILAGLLMLFGNSVQARAFDVLNPVVNPGGTVVVKIEPNWLGPEISLYIPALDKKYLPNKNGLVFIGIGLKVQPDTYIFYLINHDTNERYWDYGVFEILEPVYIKKTRRSSFTGQPKPRTDPQKKTIDGAFVSNQLTEDLTDGRSYIDPLDLTRNFVDGFGFIYENNPYRTHDGVDLRAPVGTPIKAINRGKVVLVAKRFRNEGNMLILDHGLGIFSVYMHLSRFGKVEVLNRSKKSKKISRRDIKAGDFVERGQVIGLTGRTGAGAGRDPHLHLSIKILDVNAKIPDTYVDPLYFIYAVNRYLN